MPRKHREHATSPALPRRVLLVGVLAGIASVTWGGLNLLSSNADRDVGALPTGAGPVTPSITAFPSPLARSNAERPTAREPARPQAPRPIRVSIPRLRLSAAVVPVSRLSTGGLAVPDDPAVLGWWTDGATPADPLGSTVIDGHVDSHIYGPGALFALRTLIPGDAIRVSSQGGHISDYRVVARREYHKTSFPSGTVFSADGRPHLVLVSCGGAFDADKRQYADNVVVYAVPSKAAV